MHADPEFETHTYGDILSSRAANLATAQPGDQLWFLARLWQHDGAGWRGESDFYFVGGFEVEANVLVAPTSHPGAVVLHERIPRNAHYRRLLAGDTSTFRVIVGLAARSGRFERALRITPEVAGLVFAAEYGPDDTYRRSGEVVLNRNGRPRTFARFGSITRSIQVFLDSAVGAHRPYINALDALRVQQLRGLPHAGAVRD